jgi:hypothetical protein
MAYELEWDTAPGPDLIGLLKSAGVPLPEALDGLLGITWRPPTSTHRGTIVFTAVEENDSVAITKIGDVMSSYVPGPVPVPDSSSSLEERVEALEAWRDSQGG